MAQPGLHVLLGDDRSCRRVTASALEAAGLVVSTAANGVAAREALTGTSPDVILCDLKMPVMDGLSLLAALRARAIDIPVVVVTALGSIDGAVEALQAGAINYVTKPINREELRLAIKKCASPSHQKSSRRKESKRTSIFSLCALAPWRFCVFLLPRPDPGAPYRCRVTPGAWHGSARASHAD